MTRTQTRSPRRSGFTLIELLVVIAIIVVLVSMTSAAVFRVWSRAKDVQCRSEIAQLTQAIEAFKARTGAAYVPSSFDPTLQDPESLNFMRRCWPRMDLASVLTSPGWPQQQLEGDQCLVFFLGGTQLTQGTERICQGFSTDPRNPGAAPVPGEQRIGPFFDFKSHRLFTRPGKTAFSYRDTYNNLNAGVPVAYAYFSSGPGMNDYGPDCPSIGLTPYRISATQYHNPSGFQIISAGQNGQFGMAGIWTANNAATIYPSGSAGADDIANIYESNLGNPPQ